MSKKIYLYIYFLLLTNIFMLIPFGNIALIGRGIVFTICELLWLWYGSKKYIKHKLNLSKKTNSHFCELFYISVVPSVMMAYLLFHQGIIQSFITSRNLLLFLAIPAFLKIELSDSDIIKACFLFCISSLIISLIQTMGFDSLFAYTEKMKDAVENTTNSEADFFRGGFNGIELVLIPLYYYCQKLYHNFSNNTFSKIVFLFAIVFLAQNRSTLFPAALVVGYTFLMSNMKPKLLKYFLIATMCFIGAYVLNDSILNLIEETDKQVSSTYDPRVVAMAYFFDFSRMSIGEILFGTGNISFQTSSYVQDLQEANIHYSDVGFVGFWSQYGIMPILIFLFYLIKCFFIKRIPAFVKVTAAHILICSVTISYFDLPLHMIWFILFYYLFCYYQYGKTNGIIESSTRNRHSGIQKHIPAGNA